MKILYVAMKYDYGRPEQGYSFEHYNFYHSLVHMGHDILYFDLMSLLQKHGRGWINRRLPDMVKAERPDLLFSVLFNEEFDKETFLSIPRKTDTPTVNWFCDDQWRFESFSRHWAPCFTAAVTTSTGAFLKYREHGHYNVIKSQWACNHFLYRPVNSPLRHDVSFVGQAYGERRAMIEELKRKGVGVFAAGAGWQEGRISQEEMISMFNGSRINLNLSNASAAPRGVLLRKGIRATLDKLPVAGKVLKKAGKRILDVGSNRLKDNGLSHPEQIKGRNFEVPGCGGFLLTTPAENLDDYYVEGKEIGCFASTHELAEKVIYYLQNEDERIRIAQAGYERTIKEHTYVHRFSEIFARMGLTVDPPQMLLSRKAQPGRTEEVT